MTDTVDTAEQTDVTSEVVAKLADEGVAEAFNAAAHLTKIKGQDYLEVKWRLAWFRQENPDGVLETSLEAHENGRAIFRARATKPSGASATGWGSCTVDEFEAYVEKAETKALGRALAALGYGTTAADDWDDTGALADAPVNRSGGDGAGGYQRSAGRAGNGPAAPGGYPLASNAQKGKIMAEARAAGLTDPDLIAYMKATYRVESFEALGKRDASLLIDAITGGQVRPVAAGAVAAPAASNGARAAQDPPADPNEARNRFWGEARKAGLPPAAVETLTRAEFGKVPAELTPAELSRGAGLIANLSDEDRAKLAGR